MVMMSVEDVEVIVYVVVIDDGEFWKLALGKVTLALRKIRRNGSGWL